MLVSKLFWLTGVFLMITPFINTNAAHTNTKKIEINIRKINQYFSNPAEDFSYETITSLASETIKNHQNYHTDTLAKAFSLLADAAIYKGDNARAFQFAQDGLAQGIVKKDIKLNLLKKILAGYYVKGKYNKVLSTVENIINSTEKKQDLSTLLIAYGYKASVYGLLGQYNNAYQQLQLIDKITTENPVFSNNIPLLKVIAIANHNLEDYQTSLTLHLKLLKLQFDLAKKQNIERTYYNLAASYLQLGKYDDAFNAFWQVKLIAEQKSAPIILAYAELGIGETSLKQQNFPLAYSSLVKAEKLLKGKNLTKPYISNLIALAKAASKTNRAFFAKQLLQKAELLSQQTPLTHQQIELYQLLAESYRQQGNYSSAFKALQKYQTLHEQFEQAKIKLITLPLASERVSFKNKELALKFSEKGALYTTFSQKNTHLRSIILVLSFVVISLFVMSIALWLKHRSYLLHADYNDSEKANTYMANPIKTKKNYQLNYKKARKFSYPLTITFIQVGNWHELSFHFSKKIMAEVANNIAIIINHNLNEFDQAGLINEGEYLLMFPHRQQEDISETMTQLTAELNARIFANLGEFSVIIKTASQTPNVQDIDPFAFLARLSDLLK
ncbi:MAG: hypothetical protein COB35_11165 [Gammaproteobacteria bacterium]|nr:MAG: hypothetical protein COB35_11165 [Gammaproteobacteria bacterium]